MMLTTAQAFDKFRQRLELSEREQKDAEKRHGEVRECLRGGFHIDTDFLSGSYRRHTKTKPLKDVDIFCVFHDDERPKYRNDKAPSVVLTDVEMVMAKKYGNIYIKDVIPQRMYKGMEADNQAATVTNLLAVHKDMDDKTAYTIIKTLWEHRVDLVRVHAEYLPGDVFAFVKRNTGELLHRAMQIIADEGKGVVLYLKREQGAEMFEPRGEVGVEEMRGPFLGQSIDNHIYIPITTFGKIWGRDRDIQLHGNATSTDALKAAIEDARIVMRNRHKLKGKDDDDFGIVNTDGLTGQIDRFTGAPAERRSWARRTAGSEFDKSSKKFFFFRAIITPKA
jgi:hypothetical protein